MSLDSGFLLSRTHHRGQTRVLHSDIRASIELERDEDTILFIFVLLLTQVRAVTYLVIFSHSRSMARKSM